MQSSSTWPSQESIPTIPGFEQDMSKALFQAPQGIVTMDEPQAFPVQGYSRAKPNTVIQDGDSTRGPYGGQTSETPVDMENW